MREAGFVTATRLLARAETLPPNKADLLVGAPAQSSMSAVVKQIAS